MCVPTTIAFGTTIAAQNNLISVVNFENASLFQGGQR